MATDSKPDEPETVDVGLNSESVAKLAENEMVNSSAKDGVASDSASLMGPSDNTNSSVKVEGSEKLKHNDACNSATSSYNYYFPGHNGPFLHVDDHGYFPTDCSHTAMRADDGSLVYYTPGYDPYASGAVVKMDGQSLGQQSYYPSGYPVSYGSEAIPCYSWESTYVGDVSNGNASTVNGRGSISSNSVRSKGSNSGKSSGNFGGKFSKSTYTQSYKPRNKVSSSSSDFSGIFKCYPTTGNFSSNERKGPDQYNGSMYDRENSKMWNGNFRDKARDKYQKSGYSVSSPELTCGPRASKNNVPLDSSVKNEDSGAMEHKDKYNIAEFKTEYLDAKFYVIKSYNEDDIHKSIKYDVWASTPNGNKKLDAAFRNAGMKCPIFLFFSVNGSGQFVGLAEMVGQVDFNKDMDFWQIDKWNGFFPVKWHIIKDIPNNQLRHIILENNEGRSVTFSRDTQEIGLKQGLEMLNIFKNYSAKSSLLDDFNFYEDREKATHGNKSNKPATLRMEMSEIDDFPKHRGAGERKFEDDAYSKRNSNPSSLVNLTNRLSLNSYNSKSGTGKKPMKS